MEGPELELLLVSSIIACAKSFFVSMAMKREFASSSSFACFSCFAFALSSLVLMRGRSSRRMRLRYLDAISLLRHMEM